LVPPEPCGPSGLTTVCCHSVRRTPLTLARTPATPAAGSTYLVQCAPLRGSSALGSSRRRSPHALSRAGHRRTCAWPVSEVSGPLVPFLSPEGVRKRLSWIPFPSARSSQPDPVTPGDSIPRHLPPSGFDYPLDGLLPGLAWRRPVGQRSACGIRPSGPRSARSAAPLSRPRLSCRFSADRKRSIAATPEVCSDREGARPCLRNKNRGGGRTLPSWDSPLQGFLLRRPETGFPASAPHALSVESTPYVSTSERGSRGLACDESGWPLSRLPAFLGFRTFPSGTLLWTVPESGLSNSPRPKRELASRGLFETGYSVRPRKRSSAPGRVGAALNPTPKHRYFQ
jgi:hypothetical protein